jgi:hypothetical protein
VFALLVPSCQQVWNKLLTICNNLVDIIRLVTRLFQQVRYSHHITILLQPHVINLVTFLLYHDCIRLVRTTLLQVWSLIIPSSSLQVVNSLCQTCYNNWEQAVRTQLVDSLWTDLWQLVCRPVTTCAFLRMYTVDRKQDAISPFYHKSTPKLWQCLHGSLYAMAHANTTTGSRHFNTIENNIICPRRGSTGNSASRRPGKIEIFILNSFYSFTE